LPWVAELPSSWQLGGPSAATVLPRAEGGAFLATPLAPLAGTAVRVLWLERAEGAARAEREAAALDPAAPGPARRLAARGAPEGAPRWLAQLDRAARQERLETAALVTRRLAHDFGNVLTGILGFTELALAQQTQTNTPLYNYLTEAYRGAQAGAQFTHQ